jgi:hypothetical protein
MNPINVKCSGRNKRGAFTDPEGTRKRDPMILLAPQRKLANASCNNVVFHSKKFIYISMIQFTRSHIL